MKAKNQKKFLFIRFFSSSDDALFFEVSPTEDFFIDGVCFRLPLKDVLKLANGSPGVN